MRVTKLKTNLGQPTGLKYELDKDVLSLAEAPFLHTQIWSGPPLLKHYFMLSVLIPQLLLERVGAQSCRPHGHALQR